MTRYINRSICKLKQDSTDAIRITLENHELTEVKTTENNLNDFKKNDDLNLPIWGAHSSFSGQKTTDGSLDFLAVKHKYLSRADKFKFERIK